MVLMHIPKPAGNRSTLVSSTRHVLVQGPKSRQTCREIPERAFFWVPWALVDSTSFPNLNICGPIFSLSGLLVPSLSSLPGPQCHTPFPAPKRTGPGQMCLVNRENMGEEESLVPDSALVSASPTSGVPRQTTPPHTDLQGFRSASPSFSLVRASS